MKQLTAEQIKGLISKIGLTRDVELNCSECQRHVGEFAERQLAGLPLDEALARVEHHLSICPECREEFEALEKVLRAVESD
jgi:hypothetical protein